MFILQLSEPSDSKRRVYIHLVDSTDGTTAKTGQTGKAYISKNGETPAQTTNNIVEVSASNMPGLYYVELTPSEVSQPGWIQIRYKASGTLEFQDIGQLVAFDPYNKVIGEGQSPLFAGGADIDYKKIEKIVAQKLAEMKLPVPEKPPKVDLGPVLDALGQLREDFSNFSIPTPEKEDYTPILARFDDLEASIKAIEMPETDLSEVTSKLDDAISKLDAAQLENVQTEVNALFERIKEFFDGDMEAMKTTVGKVLKKFDTMPYLILNQAPKTEEPEEKEDA